MHDIPSVKSNQGSPIWLLGDSIPDRWSGHLEGALDARHPSRHSIWTPILDAAQREFYFKRGLRLDDDALYIQNAVEKPSQKPGTSQDWNRYSELTNQVDKYAASVSLYRPNIIITFGQFAYEFARRSCAKTISHKKTEQNFSVKYWTVDNLALVFNIVTNNTLVDESPYSTIIVPLLHATIARGKFLQNHKSYCRHDEDKSGNYFRFAGTRLANLILKACEDYPIWLSDPR